MTVLRHKKKPEVQALIEKCQSELIDKGLQKATDNVIWAIDKMQTSSENQEVFKAGKEYSRALMQAIGAFPSPTTSVLIQNIVNNNQMLSPVVEDVLRKFVGSFSAPDVEGEVIEEAEVE